MRIAITEPFKCWISNDCDFVVSHTFSCVTNKRNRRKKQTNIATWKVQFETNNLMSQAQCIYISMRDVFATMNIRGNLRCMHVFHGTGFLFCLVATPNGSVLCFTVDIISAFVSFLFLFLSTKIIIFISGSQFIIVEVFSVYLNFKMLCIERNSFSKQFLFKKTFQYERFQLFTVK